jgi:predicted ATPase/class 3 adenylate cyclase
MPTLLPTHGPARGAMPHALTSTSVGAARGEQARSRAAARTGASGPRRWALLLVPAHSYPGHTPRRVWLEDQGGKVPRQRSLVGTASTPVRPAESPIVATTTFLFTDIERSTRLLQDARETYRALLEQHRRLLRAVFAQHGGREVDTQGDSFFVAFPTAGQAVAAAGDGQQALAAHPWPDGLAVRVRMGLHTGEATEADGAYVGMAVHRAARIAAAAHGGQVILSDATAALVRDDLTDGARLHDLGEHRLKDFAAPARLFQLDMAGLPTRFPRLRTLGGRLSLPAPAGTLVGRDREVSAITTLLTDTRTRIVTLTGSGGIGKTRLALAAAYSAEADFPGGAVFVPLVTVTDDRLVIDAIAAALGTRQEPGVDVQEAIAAVVGEDRTLLVLDNLEQVVSAAAGLADLLGRVPALVVLVTSRAVLRLRSEQQFPVPPLPEPEAVLLFIERAQAVRPGFAPGPVERAAVAEICRRLDGVPLAIELAAARLTLFSPEALLQRLTDRLDVLGSGPVDLPERQRTLRATVHWSLGLLAAPEQALFARLAVFSGGWELDAAERVCPGAVEPPVLDLLAALVDASLVAPEIAGSESRFTMLETVRVYALELLRARPDRTAIERRHADWALALTADLVTLHGPDYRRASQRVRRERANLRAAARWFLDTGDPAGLALLVRNAIGHFALQDPEFAAVGWLDEALELVGPAGSPVRGRLLICRAVFGTTTGDVSRMSALVAEGEPLLPAGEEYDFDRALAAVARIADALGEGLEQAIQAADVALARFTALGAEQGQAAMHSAMGELALVLGDPVRAEVSYRCAVELSERTGEEGMLGSALSSLGVSQLAQGDVVAARRSVLRGAHVNLLGSPPTMIASSLEGLAGVAVADGAPAVAARALAAAAAARGRSAASPTPALPPLVERLASRSRDLLGQEAFDDASAEGRTWSLPEALRRTLEAMQAASDEDRRDADS